MVAELIREFELNTNPKVLIGNAFAPMLAATYRDPRDTAHQLHSRRPCRRVVQPARTAP